MYIRCRSYTVLPNGFFLVRQHWSWSALSDDEPVSKNGEQNQDIELEEIIGRLLISENQENKLQRNLTDRLDSHNPLAFSKAYSDYVFNHAGKTYRISVKAHRLQIKEQDEKRTLAEQVQMLLPAFGITVLFFLAAFLTISINDFYFNGHAQVAAFLANDDSVAQILEKCGNLVTLENPNPRLSIALYAACDKQIKQIQESCQTGSASATICTDERISEYLMARRLSE